MKQLSILALVFSVPFLATGNVAVAQDQQPQKPGAQASNDAGVDLRPYLQRGSSASQLASAAAFLEDCAVPLTFEEQREDSRWTLTVICSEADNPAGVDLEFRTHETSGAYPFLEPLSFTAIP